MIVMIVIFLAVLAFMVWLFFSNPSDFREVRRWDRAREIGDQWQEKK